MLGWPDNRKVALGGALGSNVVNVALILALALVIAGIHSPRDSVKRYFCGGVGPGHHRRACA